MSLTLKMKALVEAAAFTGFGQVKPVRKARNWRTDVIGYDSGIRQTQQVLDQPIREWWINWALIDQAGRNKIKEIFDAARGQYDTFLWLDDDEFLCSGEQIATDGTETEFQLVCTYFPGESYSWTETKKDIVDGSIYAPVVTHSVDGAQTEGVDFTLDDTTGILVFGSPPSAGVLTCTFQYYFRVAFAQDTYQDVMIQPGPLYSASDLHVVEDIT